MLNLDFNNIRPMNGSARDGFEEFVCQLARKEEILCTKRFVRNGKPDGGVECYWVLEDGSEVAWQAKYFCKAFGDSQYQQIDGSVKEALSTHPNLRRYIIAVPTDPSDAHIEGRMSMKKRIDGYVERWSVLNPHVAFEFWWASDLIERIQKPQNQGMLRFWFGGYEFTDEDLIRFNADSIKDLGKRYLPKLNIEVEAAEYFEVLSRGKSLEYFLEDELRLAEVACGKIERSKYCHDALEKVESVRNAIRQIKGTPVAGIDRIALNEFLTALVTLGEAVQDIANTVVDNISNDESYRKYSRIYGLGVDVLHVYNDLHQDVMRLTNDPVLILEGDAGVGKSHLMADVVLRREKEKQMSLLFLGQKFTTDEDPLTQMMKMLHFTGTSSELLEMLDAKAETTGHRIIIFIDAINEGHGLAIWPNNIRSFIDQIRRHPWLGLVLSIRTSYQPAILPWEEFGHDYCVRAWHHGFGINTQKAVRLFFKEYDLLYPTIPFLNHEFGNPLFLRLFCEGMKNNGYRKIPDGIKGITSVMNMFFDGVEKSLRKNKFYPSSIKIVEKAVRRFIAYTAKDGRHEMPIDRAAELLSDICPRVFVEGELLDCLISEGVFSKNVFYRDEGKYGECIYLTYERFENMLQAGYLLYELKFDFKALEEYVQTVKNPYRIGGLLESLAIMLPESKGVELYDALPTFRRSKAVVRAVLSSLVWRDENTIDSHLDTYFVEFMDDDQFRDSLVRTIMEIGYYTGNYYNADYLHKMLAPMPLADRDAMWIPTLSRIYGDFNNKIIEDVINWAWNESDEVYIEEKSIELGATILSWFLASTNRKLRDTATKALVQLLHNRMLVLVPLLEKFSTVDDPYIHERLYAVALGCAVRSKSKEHLAGLCQYIYSKIFDVEDDVYPHVLLRDYAREVIEYAISIGVGLDIDVNKIRPPYHSSFNYEPVPDEEIKALYEGCSGYKDSPGLCSVLTSMFTEHTTVGYSYGDFGRYIFQSALSNWKINAELLSHLAIKLIIDKYGYREEKHGAFDLNVGSGRGRSTVPNERIGKKYQWLALHELMARVADNFPKLEHIWSEHVVKFEGPWDPFVRDIDPTTLVRREGNQQRTKPRNDYWRYGEMYDNWEPEIAEWLNIDDDIPPVEPIIELKDSEGDNWLALECYPTWTEPHSDDDIYKKLWYQVRSCIIDEDEFPRIYEWAAKQNFGGRWMPECSDRYEVFYQEYYWSPAYQYYDEEGLTKKEIYDRKTNRFIGHAEVTSIGYLWETGEDHSKEEAFYCLVPSKQLFDGMGMQHGDKEGVFMDEEGKTICFDEGAVEKTSTNLLVRKDALMDYLARHHKRIIWYVLGEKNIIGLHNYQSMPNLPMWLVISGTYTLDDTGRITGSLRTSHERLQL